MLVLSVCHYLWKNDAAAADAAAAADDDANDNDNKVHLPWTMQRTKPTWNNLMVYSHRALYRNAVGTETGAHFAETI